MKICPTCQQTFDDDDMFCGDCGVKLVEVQQEQAPAAEVEAEAPVQQPVQQQPVYQQPVYQQPVYARQPQYAPQYVQPKVRPNYDHTAEFTKEDTKSNKILAVFAYLFGIFGIIVSALINKDSKYVMFHLKQKMKMILINIVAFIVGGVVAGIFMGLGIALDVGFITALGGIIIGAIAIAQMVINIIVIIKTLCGKSVEAPLYRIVRFI